MKRPSFTLLELLLVLALISLLFGLGIAGYQRQHDRAEFTSGVVGIQIDLNRTRLLAMRTGQAYLFRFIPGTGIYEIAPLETLQEAIYRMNEESVDDVLDPLGGSLASNAYDSPSLYSSQDFSTTAGAVDSYGVGGELLSDNLFSPENIQADMEKAGLLKPVGGALTNSTGLGGSLSGGYGVLDNPSYTNGDPSALNPFASISADGMGVGGQFALGTDTTLVNIANKGITLRGMNSEERPLGAAENPLAWRINLDGLIVRKEATGGVVFTFSRLSDSTPNNLKKRRPGTAQNSNDAQGSFSDEVGEDLGSRLGGSLRTIPTSTASEGLGGGLTNQTSGVESYENALTNYEEETEPQSLWSDPVVFYPNGRASTVVVGLASLGKFSYYSEIGVRGMTGYARISGISSAPSGARPEETVLTQEQYFRMSHPDALYQSGGVESGASGGALGGDGGSVAGVSVAGAGDMTLDVGSENAASITDPTGLADLGVSGNSGSAPNYGATNRRSGYSFGFNNVVDTPLGAASASDGTTGAAFSSANVMTSGLGAGASSGPTTGSSAAETSNALGGGMATVETASPDATRQERDQNASGGGL